MLLREYAIKWWFVIPLLLTNVSALPGETWTPEIVSFQSRRDHSCHRIRIKFCVVAGFQEIVLKFIFHQKSVKWFWSCRGLKFALSIDLAVFPLIWPNQWERAKFLSLFNICSSYTGGRFLSFLVKFHGLLGVDGDLIKTTQHQWSDFADCYFDIRWKDD